MDYMPQKCEEKWLQKWKDTHLYKTDELSDKKKYYVLEMFPYPSGKLHMGHVRNYSLGDAVARFKTMQGYRVLHPMGFDSFGLPAENAAIKHGVDPEAWTLKNIETMKEQLDRIGFSYDWDRELASCQPDYYQFNQWLFIKMYEKGLVYRKNGFVNWDPVDQTVLANEQVIDGKGWRSGAVVEKKEIEQWYIKITDYAEELLNDLDTLDDWPDRVKHMQRNWIGKNTGTEVMFKIVDEHGEDKGEVAVFTTRPDTLFGVTYLVLACEHPLTKSLIKGLIIEEDIQRFIVNTLSKSTQDRTDASKTKIGYFLNHYVINPVNGEKSPLYVGDYVLMDYGTGAVMAVPAHDQRDFDFAKAHNLLISVVIQPKKAVLETPMLGAYTEPGVLINSGEFTGMQSEESKSAITHWLVTKGLGKECVTYRLRDWLISRQRFWGTPIPMLYDEEGHVVAESIDSLPIKLPKDITFGKGNPLASSERYMYVEKEGKKYRRETDTMDTFFDSSWYFLRFCDSKNTDIPFAKEKVEKWMGVDQYIGGIEHAVLHLLYARFFTKVCRDLGLCSVNEPFKRLLCQGMVIKDGAKMSKSLGNTVDPDSIIQNYGADTARLFILFGAPAERDLDWSDTAVEGAFRFLKRAFKVASELSEFPLKNETGLEKMVHKTIMGVSEDIGRFSYNTAIAKLMELTNFMYQNGCNQWGVNCLTLMLAPFAPFIAEEMWAQLGNPYSVHQQTWPKLDKSKTVDDVVTVVFQINGKVRDKAEIPKDLPKDDLENKAKQSEKIQKYLERHTIVKVIVITNKLVNIVVR